MASAFALRIVGMYATGEDRTNHLRIASFQVLSFVSPFIWLVFFVNALSCELICNFRMSECPLQTFSYAHHQFLALRARDRV